MFIFGFNRYMVECKFEKMSRNVKKAGVLIDTWWNVNYLALAFSFHHKAVLIDTWWNVNIKLVLNKSL